jgi:hypothetical protein
MSRRAFLVATVLQRLDAPLLQGQTILPHAKDVLQQFEHHFKANMPAQFN